MLKALNHPTTDTGQGGPADMVRAWLRKRLKRAANELPDVAPIRVETPPALWPPSLRLGVESEPDFSIFDSDAGQAPAAAPTVPFFAFDDASEPRGWWVRAQPRVQGRSIGAMAQVVPELLRAWTTPTGTPVSCSPAAHRRRLRRGNRPQMRLEVAAHPESRSR